MAPTKVPGGCQSPACKAPDALTPQVREGPMGSKTMCNACGVQWSRFTAGMSDAEKGAATLAACNVYHCYKASPEYAAGLKLAPGELKRRTKALAAAMMVPLSPAPAPVEAPGTPPLAAAAAAAPEFSDAGSQEEVVEAAGPSGLVEQLVAMAQADKEVAAAQVAQQSPSNLNLKRSNQMVAEEEEDYTLPTSIPKRRRSSHRAPHQQHHNRAFLVHALEEDYFPLPAVSEGAPTGAAAAGGEEATDMEVEGDDIATSAAAATGGSAVDEAAAKVLYDMLCQGMAEGHQQETCQQVYSLRSSTKRGRGEETTAAGVAGDGGGFGAPGCSRGSKRVKTEEEVEEETAAALLGLQDWVYGSKRQQVVSDDEEGDAAAALLGLQHFVWGGAPQQAVGGGGAGVAGGAAAAGAGAEQDVEMDAEEGAQQEQQGGEEEGEVFVAVPEVAGVSRRGRRLMANKRFRDYDTSSSE